MNHVCEAPAFSRVRCFVRRGGGVQVADLSGWIGKHVRFGRENARQSIVVKSSPHATVSLGFAQSKLYTEKTCLNLAKVAGNARTTIRAPCSSYASARTRPDS
jgi:hypothetical protein